MNKYKDLTQEKFDDLLMELIGHKTVSSIISLQGIYEILSEEYNNDVLTLWEEKQIENEE